MSGGGESAVNMVVMAPGDNVGVATRDIAAGATARDLRGCRQVALEPIPLGHKIALADIAPEDLLVRYGVPVGGRDGRHRGGTARARPQCREPLPRQRRGPL